jgi:hypothetical protein
MQTKKLTSEEIKSLSDFQVRNQELIIKFGQLEYEFQNLSSQKEMLINEFNSLRESEFSLSKSFREKYGDGNINLETGEIVSFD